MKGQSQPRAADDFSATQLSRTMLPLINAFAYATSSRNHAKEFRDATGITLTTAAVRMLEHLNGRPPTPVGSLARDLGLDLSRTSRLIRELEKAHHVARMADPNDSRRTLVSLDAVQPIMDQWLSKWIERHLEPLRDWPDTDLAALTTWFGVAHDCLIDLAPGRPTSTAVLRWRALAGNNSHLTPTIREFAAAAIGLYSWTAQARWFDVVLSGLHIDLGQQHYFTLRVVAQQGSLSVADIAERTGVDHTQASKRLKRLEELRLLERGVSSFDRRSSLFRCSRRGIELTDQIVSAQVTALEQAVIKVTTAPERARWIDLLTRYRTALAATGGMYAI